MPKDQHRPKAGSSFEIEYDYRVRETKRVIADSPQAAADQIKNQLAVDGRVGVRIIAVTWRTGARR